MKRRARGFTLVEVLVASAIMLTLSVLLVGFYSLSFSAYRHGEERTVVRALAASTLERITLELKRANPPDSTHPAFTFPNVNTPYQPEIIFNEPNTTVMNDFNLSTPSYNLVSIHYDDNTSSVNENLYMTPAGGLPHYGPNQWPMGNIVHLNGSDSVRISGLGFKLGVEYRVTIGIDTEGSVTSIGGRVSHQACELYGNVAVPYYAEFYR